MKATNNPNAADPINQCGTTMTDPITKAGIADSSLIARKRLKKTEPEPQN